MPTVNEWLAVAGGGAVGASLRFSAFLMAQRYLPREFPWGTLLVNVIGSALMGVAFVLLIERGLVNPALRNFLTVGLLGAFTTFSAFSLDAIGLLYAGETLRAGLYILLSVLLCIVVAMLAIWLTRALVGIPS